LILLRPKFGLAISSKNCAELDAALSTPCYGRSQMAGNEGKAGVAGHRHGSHTRSLTGTFGPIEIAVPHARLTTSEGKTTEWKSQALRA
jgi:putative transposase